MEREMGALGYSKLGSYLIQSASEGAGGKVVRRPDDIGPMRRLVPPAVVGSADIWYDEQTDEVVFWVYTESDYTNCNDSELWISSGGDHGQQ